MTGQAHLARRLGFSGSSDVAWCGHRFTGADKKLMTIPQLRRHKDACTECPRRFLAAAPRPATIDGRPTKNKRSP